MNIFPQRSYIPKYITLTGTCMLDLFRKTKLSKLSFIEGNLIEMKKNNKDYAFEVIMEPYSNKLFQKENYDFDYQIKTDGVGCSILFKSKKKLNIKESKKSKSINLNHLDQQELIKLRKKNSCN